MCLCIIFNSQPAVACCYNNSSFSFCCSAWSMQTWPNNSCDLFQKKERKLWKTKQKSRMKRRTNNLSMYLLCVQCAKKLFTVWHFSLMQMGQKCFWANIFLNHFFHLFVRLFIHFQLYFLGSIVLLIVIVFFCFIHFYCNYSLEWQDKKVGKSRDLLTLIISENKILSTQLCLRCKNSHTHTHIQRA